MLGLFPLLSTAFSPAGDNGFTTLSVELAPGTVLLGKYRVDEILAPLRYEVGSRAVVQDWRSMNSAARALSRSVR